MIIIIVYKKLKLKFYTYSLLFLGLYYHKVKLVKIINFK